ncbi:MAG: HypC/HybG/HupF family hydrogenase formation chaperone [Dehalococcoidia bacterium]|nr:MAG: HypC/HybG/HupF family hydrogenase formation chaperone [Dehalococcoidia bacterium]
MCLAIPALVKAIDGINADVEIDGVSRNINTYLTPEVSVGDYVLLHAGFSIKVIDQKEAEETINLFEKINEINKRFSQ